MSVSAFGVDEGEIYKAMNLRALASKVGSKIGSKATAASNSVSGAVQGANIGAKIGAVGTKIDEAVKPIKAKIAGGALYPLRFTPDGLKVTTAGKVYGASAGGLGVGGAAAAVHHHNNRVAKSAFGVEDDFIAKASKDNRNNYATAGTAAGAGVAGAGALGARHAANYARGRSADAAKHSASWEKAALANGPRSTGWTFAQGRAGETAHDASELAQKARRLVRVSRSGAIGAGVLGAGAVGSAAYGLGHRNKR